MTTGIRYSSMDMDEIEDKLSKKIDENRNGDGDIFRLLWAGQRLNHEIAKNTEKSINNINKNLKLAASLITFVITTGMTVISIIISAA